MKANLKTKLLFRLLTFMLATPIFWACYPKEEIQAELDSDNFTPKNSDKSLDKAVFEFHNQYQSRILYNFTEQFYNRRFLGVSRYNTKHKIVLQEDEAILLKGVEHLKKYFTDYYPEAFGKKYFPPYFLLADSIYELDYYGDFDKEFYADVQINNSFVALGKVRTDIDKMSKADLKTSKDELHKGFWNTYMRQTNKRNIDPKFFEIAGYDEKSNLTEISKCLDNDEENVNVLKYGFLLSNRGASKPTCSSSSWSQVYPPKRADDLSHFIQYMLVYDEQLINNYIKDYPKVQEKFKIVREHFKKYYGVDLQTIGDANLQFKDDE